MRTERVDLTGRYCGAMNKTSDVAIVCLDELSKEATTAYLRWAQAAPHRSGCRFALSIGDLPGRTELKTHPHNAVLIGFVTGMKTE